MELVTIPLPAIVAVVIFSIVSFSVAASPTSKSTAAKRDKGVSSISVLGTRKELFPRTRAAWRSFSKCGEWAAEGYTKCIKANSPYILPTMDRGPILIVPPTEIKKLYSLPADRLDQTDTSNASLQILYTIQDQRIVTDEFHINVIRNQLTRNLDMLTGPMVTELEKGFERTWGTASEWKTISVWHSCLTLIAGASNGVLCGPPLCRDEQFLKHMRDHSTVMFGGAIIINAAPEVLRPVVGTIIKWFCTYHYKKALKRCLPVVAKRVETTARLRDDPICDEVLPRDGLQWIIDEAFTKKDLSERDPVRLSERLLFTNDVSMHTTSFTISNLLLNLFSSNPSHGYVEALREECRTVLDAAGGTWTRSAVQKLRLLDSAIRESMRISSFSVVGLPRTVYDPKGLSIAHGNSTINIPRGTIIALPVDQVHYDEDVYPQARTFNPFRFVVPEPRPGELAKGEATGKAAVTLDDAFLGFGAGKHACPGRFFAVHEMKLMAAFALLNYEVEYVKENPSLKDFIWLKLPLNNATLRVRRLSGKEESGI